MRTMIASEWGISSGVLSPLPEWERVRVRVNDGGRVVIAHVTTQNVIVSAANDLGIECNFPFGGPSLRSG
jgi:hypothetical protein